MIWIICAILHGLLSINPHNGSLCKIPLYLCTEENIIIIDASKRTMEICLDGIVIKRFPISTGKNGIEKKRKGDNKTPLGLYSLGEPRPSERFGFFIPLDYPSIEQLLKGYSGDSIGIHGPRRNSKNLHIIDWTEGCISTESDNDIIEIMKYIKQLRIDYVLIR